jgi:hypothetical protein
LSGRIEVGEIEDALMPVKGRLPGIAENHRAGRPVRRPARAEDGRGQTSASFTMPLALPKSMRPG